jgi:hypothetical protein
MARYHLNEPSVPPWASVIVHHCSSVTSVRNSLWKGMYVINDPAQFADLDR